MLELADIHTFYGSIEALKGISLTVHQGEIVGLIGANGAGKTTTLMTVCGKPSPASGRIVFDGQTINGLKTHEIVRLGIAHAPEGRRIFPRMTVLENLQLGAVTAPPAVFAETLEEVFALFPILAERRQQNGGTLSGGEQQMLSIGRALMSRPRLLLLDEPSLGLAPMVTRQIFRTIAEINRQRGITVLLVEQKAFEALRLVNRAYVMASGRILMSGSGAELLQNPEIRAAYLEGGAPGAGREGG